MSRLNKGNQPGPKVMNASDFVHSRELQREYRQRVHPNITNTYKDVIGETLKGKEVDERFYRKNLDYASFAKAQDARNPPVSSTEQAPITEIQKAPAYPPQATNDPRLNNGLPYDERSQGPYMDQWRAEGQGYYQTAPEFPPIDRSRQNSIPKRPNGIDQSSGYDYGRSQVHPNRPIDSQRDYENSAKNDPIFQRNLKKFYGDETPKDVLPSNRFESNSLKLMNRKTHNSSLNNSIDPQLNRSGVVGGNAYSDIQANHLSNSYVQQPNGGSQEVSGFFMKGTAGKETLLQQMRAQSEKQRLDNITKRLAIPYKNETRKTKINFFSNSQVGAPKTSMKHNYATSKLYGSYLPPLY